MVPTETVNRVNLSYGRCSMKPEFFDTFYDIFLKSSDAIAAMFKNTDFTKQKALLKSGIAFTLMYAKDEKAAFAKMKLDHIGDIHKRGHRDVPPNMYPLWIDSLMKSVKQHDPEFSPALEQDWRTTIKPAIDLLISHY